MTNEKKHNEHFEELCAGYVLDALEPEEREQFEELLREADDEQLELFHSMSSAANQLAFSMEPAEPAAGVKERLMARISEEQDEDGAAGTTPISREEDSTDFDRSTFAIAASFALLLVTLSLVFYSFNLRNDLGSKEEVIEQQQARITELKSEIQQKEELLSILEAREVDLVIMAGLEVNPDGYGKIIWDSKNDRALLQVSNLPPVPADKDYQLWIIKNNKPVSAGVFAVNDPKKDAFFKIDKMQAPEATADAFAITMEPKGGVPQPTGDMYLLGKSQ